MPLNDFMTSRLYGKLHFASSLCCAGTNQQSATSADWDGLKPVQQQ